MNDVIKTAIVHEWLVNYAGSEKCVESFTNIWPDADVFCLVEFLTKEEKQIILKNKPAITSFVQSLPFAKKHHRSYFPLFPIAVEQYDLRGYDVVISSSHSYAKGVLTDANQLHICYCHTPIRYAWDLYHQYLQESGLSRGLKGTLVKYLLHKIRMWDIASVNRVNHFIANSNFIARRIYKHYDRTAKVIYPPVDVDKFNFNPDKENYYLTAARFVPYKKVDLIIDTFNRLPDRKLLVIGDGPDEKKLKRKATRNIEFLGYLPQHELSMYMQRAKAFVFAAEEDFGITVIEAHACGTPVIALDRGGTAETIKDGKNGILFSEQNVDSLLEAVIRFEEFEDKFDLEFIYQSSLEYARNIFEEKISEYVNQKCEEFF
jgi:glycosyltransferase involved in cell wall biosynthesis